MHEADQTNDGAAVPSDDDGRAEASLDRLHRGAVLGKYRIVRFIAAGAMGMVYEAEHVELRTRHALKTIRGPLAADERFLRRFRREARLMANLQHPNIAHVTDFGSDGGQVYFVMEYVAGPSGRPVTLQDLLGADDGPQRVPEEEVQDIFLQVADALVFCHHFRERGVIHRDLKPTNILLRMTDGTLPRVAITDFGLAEACEGFDSLATSCTAVGLSSNPLKPEISGTPRYMSPEQWQPGSMVGPESDIFSLGVLLYQCLTGRLPFADSRALLQQPPVAVERPSRYGCSPRWDPIVARCLSAAPAQRYRDARELAHDLERVFRRPLLMWAGGALALFALAASFLYVSRERKVSIPPMISVVVTAPVSMVSQPMGPPAPRLVPVQIGVRIAPGMGQPYALPSQGEIQVGDGGWQAIQLPHVKLLPKGVRAQLRLRVPGFRDPEPEQVEPGEETANTVFDLVPNPARLIVACTEPEARVYKDDEDLGPVGQVLELAAFEDHRLVVRSPRHHELVMTINRPGPTIGPPQVMQVDLETVPGRIRIEAAQPGLFHPSRYATILMNGEVVGRERLPVVMGGITQAYVDVAIQMEGFKHDPPRRVAIKPGQEVVERFDLHFQDAWMRFDIDPTNAVVMLSGSRATSSTVSIVPNQIYSVRVEAPDRYPRLFTVGVTAGETHVVSAQLVPFSFVDLVIEPPSAAVFIGPKRYTQRRLQITPGQRTQLEFRAPGYHPASTNVQLSPGESRQLDIRLHKKFF